MVFVYGATGRVGQRIALLLSSKTDVIISGRNESKLKALAKRICEITGYKPKVFPFNISEMLKFEIKKMNVKVLLNLAYLPYESLETLIGYAVSNGINYIDISEKAKHVLNIWRKYDILSKMNKVSVVQSAGFLSAAEESSVCELTDAEKIHILYDSILVMSPGSIKSLIYLLSSAPTYTEHENIFWHNGNWFSENLWFRNFNGMSYVSLPTPSVATVPRILNNVNEFRTYLYVPEFLKPFIQIFISLNRLKLRVFLSNIIRSMFINNSIASKDDKIIMRIFSEGRYGQKIEFRIFKDPIGMNEKIILFCVDKFLDDSIYVEKGVLPPTLAFPDLRSVVRYETVERFSN